MALAELSDDQRILYESAINTMAFADICDFVISLWPTSISGEEKEVVDLDGRKYSVPAAESIQDRIGLTIDDLKCGVLFSNLHWNVWILVHRALLGFSKVELSVLDREVLQAMFVSSLMRRLADADLPGAGDDALEDQKVIGAYFERNPLVADRSRR